MKVKVNRGVISRGLLIGQPSNFITFIRGKPKTPQLSVDEIILRITPELQVVTLRPHGEDPYYNDPLAHNILHLVKRLHKYKLRKGVEMMFKVHVETTGRYMPPPELLKEVDVWSVNISLDQLGSLRFPMRLSATSVNFDIYTREDIDAVSEYALARAISADHICLHPAGNITLEELLRIVVEQKIPYVVLPVLPEVSK